MTRPNVLIVGAGPTGLTLAVELARRDIAVRVIDKSPEYFAGSRGKGLAPRSQEVFDNIGVQDRIEASGFRHFRHRRWVNGSLVSDADPAAGLHPTPGVPYDSGILIAQWRIEEILREKLAEYGVAVELGTELIEFSQSADAVTATLGTRDVVVADYLIGCDGGRSTIRKSVDATFEGESGPQAMLIGDVLVEGLTPDAWHMWNDADRGFVALCPFRDWPAWQFQGVSSADFSDGRLPPPSLEYFQRIFDDIAGIPGVVLSEPSWLSTYQVNVRMVDRFRFGRVFLAGDAAHVHPPAGGLGMNTGIQDAHNLGWKLALVLAGKAEPGLLDTYGEERVPVAEWTLGVSSTEMARFGNAIANRTLDSRARYLGELQQEQLALGYRWSSLAKDLLDRPDGPCAGDRAPDSPCQDGAGTPIRLFDVFRSPWFTLLGFGVETTEALASVCAKHGDLVTSRLIARTAVPDADLVDVDGHAYREYAIKQPTLVLVRPDGHLGLIAPAEQGAAALAYLDDVLCR